MRSWLTSRLRYLRYNELLHGYLVTLRCVTRHYQPLYERERVFHKVDPRFHELEAFLTNQVESSISTSCST